MASQISLYYDKNATIVSTLCLVFSGIYIVFTYPSNFVIDIHGCKTGIILGTILTAIGMIVKVWINTDFWICVLGQVLAAIGQPFILNTPAKLAGIWFGQNERVIAILIAVAFQAIGTAVGFVLPTFFTSPDDSREEFRENIQFCLLV